MLDPFANARAFGIGGEIVELSAPEVISRAVLMQNPQNFVWMSDQIGGKLHPHYEVDALSVGGGEIEHAPGHRAAHYFRRRIPLEGQRNYLDLMTGLD